MVRETRHLWVGNLPDNIREDRIREHFKRYGRVQSVKLLPRCTEEKTGEITMACTVAFMDIKSASKAHNSELKIDDRTLNTEYYEPAAIPSAASPQNTSSPYSNFPNGHGSSDEHGTFQERFYDRSTTRVAAEGEFIRRTGYHDANRSRNRDRSYRNGPYNPLMDRHSRTINNSWTYDSTRYNSTTGCNQTETGYNTTPSDTNERRNSDQSLKKKTKSRSGSRSPSPSGSTSSRSPSRSRSRSSSSSSSSSTSRATSSTGSPKSRRLASGNHQPVVHSDDRRPLAICVRNLPLRSSDTSLKDGLFHEYKKHGKVTWVKVVGQNSERHAIVCFKKPEDVEKALEVSYDKLFFGCKIEVAPYQGYELDENDLRPYEAEIDEFHPKATRTLFIGNLEKDVTASDLRKHFDQFGEIIEIDIKKQAAVSSYAFCQYSDIASVVKAIRKMDGEHLGNNRIKLGFGKSMAYNCVWIDGVNENVNEKYLRMQFEQFGVITKVHIDREKGQALIFFEQVSQAQAAVTKIQRGFTLKGTRIQVDYASRECQESFFERLEKQGAVLDRSCFEERRDSTTRTFETTTASRFSRYDTPTRPRTSSYSSRSSAAASQVTSAMQSPGTPGSVTPRTTGTRARGARAFAEYYDANAEYPDRHIRNYDEYSQGSAASHEDPYEPEFVFHDSPTQVPDPLEPRTVPSDTPVVLPPPDIRNLQKERVHLLEQLEECPSSGDELISPRKRLKMDVDPAAVTEVIVDANRDHRKAIEVRKLSEANVRHHSRRPSGDSGKHVTREVGHERSGYLPHTVCKRRKTGGSDSGSRLHHYDHSGSESVGGSRPGTPLCDERPENFQPSEPRRAPREREGPLTLPLPRFAAQVMNRGNVSVAGIKGQKENILASPPAAATSPRITNPRPPSPVHVPPPASPPPRPPSLSSNSSDSDITPPSPSLEERIRSLDEKYEKWSGSRALSAAGGDALAMLDANLEKFRLRHKLLNLDLKEVQPSEIVKSVMAKRSVFDEDLKRLENVGEKYEPKEFSLFPRTTATAQTPVPAAPLSAPPTLKLAPIAQLPKTPTMLSPRSAGSTSLPAAKGLQYPFPTHPPVLMSPVPAHPQTPPTPTTSASLPAPSATSTTTTRSASHGDNRLKPCASASSDIRTTSKINVNRSTVVSSLAPSKTSEKINANIPNAPDVNVTSGASFSSEKHNKSVREVKSSDKTSEKIFSRRDSNSSSPRADVKTRRNSDTSARRIEDSEKFAEMDSGHRERAKSEEDKKDRLEKVRLENEKLEREKQEKERVERERMEKEKQERIRLEKERLEKERLERESELEKERLEKERQEKERLEKENERARLEKERIEKEQLERERIERERQEHERLEKERRARERREREERERKEKEERERREREEQQERERQEMLEKEKKERERKEKEEREMWERKEREERERREEEEKLAREKAERERAEKEKLERERKREEERSRHKDDNHDKRKEDHKHHKENSVDKHAYDNKNTKDTSNKDNHDPFRRESHGSHEKSRHHIDRDAERRKESIKENRDNNIHDKYKSITDLKEANNCNIIESRHMSIDLDKNRSYDNTKQEPNKRKERNNSLPANIGSKRRLSSHDGLEGVDESKKLKLSHDHKKLADRRDSKDSTRSDDRSKSKHKNNVIKSHEKHSSKENDEKRKEREKEREERHKKHKNDKQKSKSRSQEKESRESPSVPNCPPIPSDKEFLARLNLVEKTRSTENKDVKENKEKRKEPPAFSTYEEKDKLHEDRGKKDKLLTDKHNLEKHSKIRLEQEKKRDRIRKITNSSESDSDEPKKHSIFDIVDDEPAYISMYDKVKARSCKNMAKQEEEKRQEKIKAKFSQLKQSRAKREEKKRSTSWDEDSESEDKDSNEIKIKRCPKMLIDSSDDEGRDRKIMTKKEIYSDSDSSAILKQIKREQLDTSEDEIKNKSISRGSKSRITSDTSEDEYSKRKLHSHLKTEIFSDPENANIQGFMDTEEKPQFTKVKEELDRIIKKERRNSKHQESSLDMSSQMFGDSSTLNEKIEKFANRHQFIENTTDDEITEAVKKERSERREKKHKKKQKKQKHSLSSEDSCKIENESGQTENSDRPKHEKKKDHSKKEKRRDKTKEGREKSKKSKKNKSEIKTENKREGKMENIFGSLSEDSEHGTKELDQQKNSLFHERVNESENIRAYNSESEREQDNKAKEKEEREREREDHKRRKEKKRREKERRLQEAAAAAAAVDHTSNDNSMDYADMGKQLEANMMKEESIDASEEITKSEVESSNLDDPFRFTDIGELTETKKDKEDRKEGKEKKKKRKKSKDEKTKHHHHHHHHHEKNHPKVKSPEIKQEVSPPQEIKVEVEEPQPQNQSLPTLDDSTNPTKKPITPEFTVSPPTRDIRPTISPIPKTPTTSKEKKREKFIPGFGVEIDEKIHESAVKSISEFEPVTKKEEIVKDEEDKDEKEAQVSEEKPRVVISQEETEDAVAALLGESFENGKFEECYTDEITATAEQSTTLAEEDNAQDDEEMRQAVQSLSAADLDVKPDTPQSEHELQIDTDTEEQEEVSRFDSKTPDLPDFSQPPKTPDIPTYIRNEEKTQPSAPVLLKSMSNIGSPPSLTPIKPQLVEMRKTLELEQKSLPMLPEQQQRSVISQAWPTEKLPETLPKTEPAVINIETKKLPSASEQPQQNLAKTIATPVLRQYSSPPMVKIPEPAASYPALKPISQPPKVPLPPTKSASQLHNLPARSPVQINKPPTSVHDSGVLSPKPTSNIVFKRLPITPVMVSKPLQATTAILQQSKIAHTLEPPKLVSSSDSRPRERTELVFVPSNIQPSHQQRNLVQGNRQLPPQGLLVPTRQLPQNTYGYLGNISHTPYISPIVKDMPTSLSEKNPSDPLMKISQPVPSLVTSHCAPTQTSIIIPPSSNQTHLPPQQTLSIPKDQSKVITSTANPVLPPNSKSSPLPASSPKPVATTSSPCPVMPPNPTLNMVAHEASKVPDIADVPVDKKFDTYPNIIQKPTSSPVIVSAGLNQEVETVTKTEPKAEVPIKLAIEKATEELHLSLEKESPKEPEIKVKEVKPEKVSPTIEEPAEVKPEIKTETKDISPQKEVVVEKPAAIEHEPTSVIKEIEKFDEEKADTESIVSDISKERSSADILAKDDPLDTKEDSDYWSAKEVNIDSVIKTLCSADELSDHSSENGKDEWFEDTKPIEDSKTDVGDVEDQSATESNQLKVVLNESETHDESVEPEEQKEVLNLRSGNRGRNGRGRGRGKAKGATNVDRSGIQTRRGKVAKDQPTFSPTKRGRGGRPRSERKASKSELDVAPADVYEFRDESDDNKEQRPRLILTIKSPAISSACNAQTIATVKEVTKDGAKEIGKEQPKQLIVHPIVETKEEFASPVTTNTRKSRRLQEKDNSRNTVDDTIEDVVKNTIQTRASSNQRRSPRQAAPKQQALMPPETPRKSPRGRKPRRGSEATENSSSDETFKDDAKPVLSPAKETLKIKEVDKPAPKQQEPIKEKPHESLKAAMLRRIKVEMANLNQHEPTNLIDPVTGELIPMRECEEGKYIPLPPGSAAVDQRGAGNVRGQAQTNPPEPIKYQPTVIAPPQQATVVQSPVPQSFKAHVLSSQAAQAVVTQQPASTPGQVKPLSALSQPIIVTKTTSQVNISKSSPVIVSKTMAPVYATKTATPTVVTKAVTPIVISKPVTPIVMSKPVTPISQHLNVNTSLSMGVVSSTHLSPRSNVPLTTKTLVKPPTLSPVLALTAQQKQQILQVSKAQLTKGHIGTPMVTSQAQMVNTQMAHMKNQPIMKQQQVIMGKGPIGKPAHSLHQQQILSGATPSPPLAKSQSPLNNPSRIIQGPPIGAKGVMEPPKVDVAMANVMLGQRPKLSPQGPQQRILQGAIPVAGYEASLGETIPHFPPGPLRPPPDLNPAHYMHPSHVMQYQQYLRQQQLQHMSRSGGIEKVGDGQEGEEAPVTSPPLELRRPGSVGLALTGRGASVPHSLHSPHDRATDSPQVGQVYNVHSTRMHYHSGRYYDQAEPPPAHRPLTSHSTLAALGSDRGLAHMAPLGTPDRPLSGHTALSAHMGGLAAADRPPISTQIERPLSSHGTMGAGLGAAGNLMGAVARHVGAEAPTSQRGLQAATPPHASQVPPQAESLFMLLKQYPCMWQGLLALKNDQAAVQMYFVSGNDNVAKCSLPKNIDGSTPPLRIFQRMRLEPLQVEGVARKMQMENEHCMLLALPCGHDHMDVLKQSTNLTSGFITYLQQKQAAGIVNVAAPGTTQPPAYVVHIFPSCDFVNENLRRIAPSLLERVADIAHLLIVITTV